MSKDDGSHSADVVDVRVPVDVLQNGTMRPGEVQRGGPLREPDVAVDAPGQHPLRAPKVLFGSLIHGEMIIPPAGGTP